MRNTIALICGLIAVVGIVCQVAGCTHTPRKLVLPAPPPGGHFIKTTPVGRGTPDLIIHERNTTVRVIPAPSLKVEVDGVEIDENGGQSFTWHVAAKNNEERAIDLTISTKFTVDTGEEISAVSLEFVLQPGESRSIDGPPIHLKKRFREVNGVSTPTAKHYVK